MTIGRWLRCGLVLGVFLARGVARADEDPAWEALGAPVPVDVDGWVNEPALATDANGAAVLSFATGPWNRQGAVHVWRLEEAAWSPLGAPLAGALSAMTLDAQGSPYVCAASPTWVHRWDGAAWRAVGGDIARETGLSALPRFSIARCAGVALDARGSPHVSLVGHDAPPLHTNRTARLDVATNAWRALPEAPLSEGRAAGSRLVRDARGALYLATFVTTEVPSVRREVRVLRRDGDAWTPLGLPFDDAYAPALLVREDAPHVAFQARDGTIRVLRFDGAEWGALPSPGAGGSAALAVDAAGRLVLAHTVVLARTPPAQATIGVVVKVLAEGAWRALPSVEGDVLAGGVTLALTIDGDGRAVIAVAGTAHSGRARLVTRRARRALP